MTTSIIVLLIILMVAAINDRKTLKIPNVIFPIALFLSMILYALDLIQISLLTMFINFLIIFVPLLIFWAVGTMFSFKVIGAGDVKLLGILPFFLSLEHALIVIGGSLMLSVLLSINKVKGSNMKEAISDLYYFVFFGIPGSGVSTAGTRVAYAPFIFMSTLLFSIYYFVM